MQRVRSVFFLLQKTAETFSLANGPLMAAAIAYYSLFSTGPLLILLAGIATRLAGSSGFLYTTLSDVLTPEVAAALNELVTNYSYRAFGTLPTVINFIIMFVGASVVFTQMKAAINRLWGIAPRPERSLFLFLRTQGLAFLAVMAICLLVVIFIFGSSFLSAFFSFILRGSISIPVRVFAVGDFIVTILILTLSFMFLFKVMPDAHITWRDVGLGASVTAVAFAVGESLLAIYFREMNPASAFGIAGSVIVLLVWVYFSAQFILFGAAFTKVFADQYGSRVQPSSATVLFHPLWFLEGAPPHPSSAPSKPPENPKSR